MRVGALVSGQGVGLCWSPIRVAGNITVITPLKKSILGENPTAAAQGGCCYMRLISVRERQKVTIAAAAARGALDLTEDNVRDVLDEARVELGQIFDVSVGMTGEVELAELDGPFVKISLKGRFWHKRSTVLARISNFLKLRIPEILEVEIEDEKQLDDSPANF